MVNQRRLLQQSSPFRLVAFALTLTRLAQPYAGPTNQRLMRTMDCPRKIE